MPWPPTARPNRLEDLKAAAACADTAQLRLRAARDAFQDRPAQDTQDRLTAAVIAALESERAFQAIWSRLAPEFGVRLDRSADLPGHL